MYQYKLLLVFMHRYKENKKNHDFSLIKLTVLYCT